VVGGWLSLCFCGRAGLQLSHRAIFFKVMETQEQMKHPFVKSFCLETLGHANIVR